MHLDMSRPYMVDIAKAMENANVELVDLAMGIHGSWRFLLPYLGNDI